MPYKKTGRKTYGKKSAYSIARKALVKVNKISKGIEYKTLDTDNADTTLAQVGTVFDLFDPSTGTADNQKIGDKCCLKRMTINMSVKTITNTDLSIPDGHLRWAIIKTKGKIASDPTVGNVFKDTGIVSLWNKNTSLHFNVLNSGYVHLGAFDSVNNNYPGVKPTSVVKTIRPKVSGIIYDDDGGNENSKLYFVCYHNLKDETVDIDVENRCVYTDN